VEIANQLARLQKRAADIVISHKRVLERNLELFREPEGGVIARVRNGHDDVGFDWKLAGKLAAHLGSDLADGHAADFAVRTREVNILEHTERGALRLKGKLRTDPVFVDNQNFPRLHVAYELGMNQ